MSLHDPADPSLLDSLARMGLLRDGEVPRIEALTGGVSSDIFRVDLPGGPICIKRALARLKVSADWFAPVERNLIEVAYLRYASDVVPGAVPAILASDEHGLAFAMPYLAPDRHPVWKNELRDGRIDLRLAAQVGDILGRLHSASARDAALPARFATDEAFYALRLEPYLAATAARHPERAARLSGLLATTASTRRVLVHGDVSPKNILCGPTGPVLLDAECAWFGDPAFDLAFCLNHLLLKTLWRPDHAPAFDQAFEALTRAYLARVDWEPAPALEARTAALLPALNLARVDGKSPVEYLTQDAQRAFVRRAALPLLDTPSASLADTLRRWREKSHG